MAKSDRQKYLFPVPTAGEIAKAASQAIYAVKADHGVTDIQMAALIDAKDIGVIARLEKQETKKVPASLFSAIAAAYGPEYVKAYTDLMGVDAVPKHCEEAINALPKVTALAAKLAAAMTNGREKLDHVALAGMLADLRAVDGVVSALRSRAHEMGLAA